MFEQIDCRALVPDGLIHQRAERYVSMRCLWHDDHSPSCLVYADGYHCMACGAWGGVVALQMALAGVDKEVASATLAGYVERGEYKATETATPAEREAKLPQQNLGLRLHHGLTDEAMAYYAYERGLSPATVARYQLGWGSLYHGGPEGYTVPIYRDGKLRQIKQRLPGLEKNKYRSIAGCGSWLYLGEDVAWGERVIVAGGEFDAIVARQYGYLACAPTGGEARFHRTWLRDLTGTTPYCAYDADEKGELGYGKLKRLLGGNLKRVRLPRKDLTLFFLDYGPDDFDRLLDEADERFYLGEDG